VAIGDTFPSVDPVWGEGIHKGMRSARAAAAVVDKCLTEGDTSAENVATYDDLWDAEVTPGSTARLAIAKLLYLAPNERYDAFLRDLNAAGEATLKRANRGNPLGVAKLLRATDVPLLFRFARQWLRGG
jgi:digeranylgeranylglycerophospholipid reductase